MTQNPTGSAPVDGSPDDPVENLWAWVDRVEDEASVDVGDHHVAAVLVAMDATDWLPQTLTALAAARPGPDLVIAVDNASSDTTTDLLAEARDAGTIDVLITSTSQLGFGAAVVAGLEGAADREQLDQTSDPTGDPASGDRPTRWLWLLHDDVMVQPDTLTQLLRQATATPDLAVTGPKLVRPPAAGPAGRTRSDRPQPVQLSELGVTIAGSGRRELFLEPGEVDQGQHDEPRAVLAVSTCAMLVRRDVWDELGGLTDALPVFRDGVDFGWRANRAGHQVMTTPSATAVHRQVGRAGLRSTGPSGSHPLRLDRALGLHVIQGHTVGAARPFVGLRLVLGCLARTLGFLIGKAPGRAGDELSALGSFLGHPGRTRAVRERVQAGPQSPGTDAVVSRLRPPWWAGLALGVDNAGRAVEERSVERVAGREQESTSLDELTGDDFAGAQARPPLWRSAVAVTVAGAIVLAVIAARDVFVPGRLASTALLPSGSWSDGWSSFVDPVAGATGATAPWLGWIAAASTLLFGQPEWLITVLLCGIIPLAFLAAYPVLARLVPDRRVRWWGAITWAVLPPLLGGTHQGRLSLAVVAIALPLTALAVHRLATDRVTSGTGLRGAWGTGIGLAVLTAFEPVLWPVALVGAVLAVLVLRRRRVLARAAIALAIPVVLWSPWWIGLAASGRLGRLLVGPDPALVPVGTLDVPVSWALLLGRAGGSGLPSLWVSAVVVGVIWLTALVALLVAPKRRATATGWVLAVVALALAVGLSRLVVPVSPLLVETRPWVGALVLVGFGGLILAASTGLGDVFDLVATRSFGALQPLSVLAAVLIAAISLLGAGWYLVVGAAGPLHRDELRALPPYVRDAQLTTGVRTLAITIGTDGAAGWSLIGDDQLRLGSAERGFGLGAESRAQLDGLTRRLVGGAADEDIVATLAGLGVQYVWVSGAGEDEQIQIGNTPGLVEASGTTTARVWRVSQPTGRVLVLTGSDPAGQTSLTAAVAPVNPTSRGRTGGTATVAAGAADRTLVLAEAADPRWRVTLDGVALDRRADSAGRPAFVLPASGGELSWQLVGAVPDWVMPLGQGLALLVLIVLALPALRPESRHPTTAARRAAGVPTRGAGPR